MSVSVLCLFRQDEHHPNKRDIHDKKARQTGPQ